MSSCDHNERERVRKGYQDGAKQYDAIRNDTSRGNLLSSADVGIFQRLLPENCDKLNTLEVGAGTGRFTVPALRRGCRLIATDINEEMLSFLRDKIRDTELADRCEIRIDDIFNLSFEDERFDLVFCFHVIPRFLTLEDQQTALRELCRVVKPGGTLMFNYRNSKSPWQWIKRCFGQSPNQVEQLLTQEHMRITQVRTKHLLNRQLLDRVPLFVGKSLRAADRVMETIVPGRGWDIFIRAEKRPS